MKILRVFLVCIGAGLSFQLAAQGNLVPNGSFEEYVSCPMVDPNCADLEESVGWYTPIVGTTDFYHECSCPDGCCIPGLAADGDGMIAMIVFGGGGDSREYAACGLTEALQTDSVYEFSIKLHLLNGQLPHIGSYGAYFSADSSTNYDLNHDPIGLTPQLQRDPDSLMSDPNIWYLWKDTLIAEGGELFLIIGNFLSDSLTPNYQPSWQSGTAYYIDDVTLVQIPKPKPDGITELKVRFGISPNPATSIVQIDYYGNLNPKNTDVYTITGKLVRREAWKKHIDVSGLPDGIYLLKVEFDNGAVGVERLVIQR